MKKSLFALAALAAAGTMASTGREESYNKFISENGVAGSFQSLGISAISMQDAGGGTIGQGLGVKPRGFAAMTPERQREIASQGGRAVHALGNGNQFTSATGRAAAKKRGTTGAGATS